jgi:hypothetical protein
LPYIENDYLLAIIGGGDPIIAVYVPYGLAQTEAPQRKLANSGALFIGQG